MPKDNSKVLSLPSPCHSLLAAQVVYFLKLSLVKFEGKQLYNILLLKVRNLFKMAAHIGSKSVKTLKWLKQLADKVKSYSNEMQGRWLEVKGQNQVSCVLSLTNMLI